MKQQYNVLAQLKEGIPLPNVKGFSLNNSVMTIENVSITGKIAVYLYWK